MGIDSSTVTTRFIRSFLHVGDAGVKDFAVSPRCLGNVVMLGYVSSGQEHLRSNRAAHCHFLTSHGLQTANPNRAATSESFTG
jgi:hypothetical protein